MPKVTCVVCGKTLDYTKEQAVHSKKYKRRYSHYTCEPDGELVPLPQPKPKVEKKKVPIVDPDRQKILDYCKELFGDVCNYARINQQLNQYIQDNGYTLTGIYQTMVYFYQLRHGDPKKANGTLGIIPFIYAEAKNYYYNLWLAQQQNINKDISQYKPKEVWVRIPVPARKTKRKKMFSFLDRDEVD